MTLNVTKEMRKAMTFMRRNSNVLIRYPGGFWTNDVQETTFGTSTVEALVKRGLAEYTQWRDGRNGRFPIEARLK